MNILAGIIVPQAKDLKLVGAIVTHYHFDHTGGLPPPPFDTMGVTVSGIKDLADLELPVYVHQLDSVPLQNNNHVPKECIRELEHDSIIQLGESYQRNMHTVVIEIQLCLRGSQRICIKLMGSFSQ